MQRIRLPSPFGKRGFDVSSRNMGQVIILKASEASRGSATVSDAVIDQRTFRDGGLTLGLEAGAIAAESGVATKWLRLKTKCDRLVRRTPPILRLDLSSVGVLTFLNPSA